MDNFLAKFADCEPLLARFAKIRVGFSGGADSTALLVLLANLAGKLCFEIEAVHFEHGIRGGESLADAEWCREFCERRYLTLEGSSRKSIPFNLVNLDIAPDTPNLEAVARSLRMRDWKRLTSGSGEAVALGHHAGDKVENLFLRLLRGSNSTGLTSLRVSRVVDGVTFIRPLLSVTRSEIEAFLVSIGVEDWRRDRTNLDESHRRNFIRNSVISLLREGMPDVDKALLRSLAALEDDAVHLECESAEFYGRAKREVRGKTRPVLSVAVLAEASKALRPRILRLWLADALGEDMPPSADFMERFNRELETRGAGRMLIPFGGGVSLAMADGELHVISDNSETAREREPGELVWNWRKDPSIAWNGWRLSARIADAGGFAASEDVFAERSHRKVFFSIASMPDTLVVRSRRTGDRMVPFGSTSQVRLKRLLQGAGVGEDDRRSLPVVAVPDGTIIWVPLVRRADFANLAPPFAESLVELVAERDDSNC